MKIAIFDGMYIFPEHKKELEILGECYLYEEKAKTEEEAIERVRDADIVIDFWSPMPKAIINQLKNTKMIVAASSGYDWIDVNTAKEKGIIVTNCPGNNKEAVAEHTIGLLLAVLRKIPQADKTLREEKWQPYEFKGYEIQGKTVGIIGYGRIGKRVGEILQNGFGATVQSINSRSERGELENLLKTSDIICINAPLTGKTEKMLSEKEFSLMKQNVIVINTGRGGIIDEAILIQNLQSGKIYGAGLDTYTNEPLEKNSPLLMLTNVVLTPHIAWNTNESEYRISQMVLDNIKAFVQGTPRFVVN